MAAQTRAKGLVELDPERVLGGQSPKLQTRLVTLANQTDPKVIRRILLTALDEVTDMSVQRLRETKDGRYYADPDHACVIRAIELASRITGAIGGDPTLLIKVQADTEKLIKQATAKLIEREQGRKDGLAIVTSGDDT